MPGPEYASTHPKSLIGGKPVVAVSNVSQPTMTVYPPTGKNTGAAVAVFPGGGFQILAMDLEGTDVCDWGETPPAFLVQAENDNVDGVEQSLVYFTARKHAGVPTEMYAHGGDAFGLRPTSNPITRWPALAETWVSTVGMIPAAGR